MEVRRGSFVLLLAGLVALAGGWVTGSLVSPAPAALESAGPTTTTTPVPVGPTTRPTPTITSTIRPTTTTTTTTTTTPPTTEPAGPTRVLLAGDSVMAGLAPAVEAALEPAGLAEVEFVLTPSVLRDDSVRFTWQLELDDFDPDVVVMLVGTWELGEVSAGRGQSVALGQPGWQDSYLDEVLDPWLDLVTSGGAGVVWIGAPSVESEVVTQQFQTLNQAFAALPARHPGVSYLDPAGALGGVGGGWTDIVQTASGPQRVRQVDGLHLCPDGAARLTDHVAGLLGLAPGGAWRSGSWRSGESYPLGSCPSP